VQGLAILRAIDLADEKKQRRDGLDQHLRVVARGFQFSRACEQRRLQLLGVLDGEAQRDAPSAWKSRPAASITMRPWLAKRRVISRAKALAKVGAALSAEWEV